MHWVDIVINVRITGYLAVQPVLLSNTLFQCFMVADHAMIFNVEDWHFTADGLAAVVIGFVVP